MTTMFYGAHAQTFKTAKVLRSTMTEAEKLLWNHLSKNKLDNYRFRRQHPAVSFIADFYCHKAKLIVEVDGEIHQQPEQARHDADRTQELEALGVTVIRFTNHQVKHHIKEVLNEIRKYLPLRGG